MVFEYRKANINDINILTELRIAMLCDGAGYSDEFKRSLYDNTTSYMAGGFADKSFTAWVATLHQEIMAMGGIAYYLLGQC